MKTSNILIIALVAFVIGALVYEKVLLLEASKKIDQTIPFGDYNNVVPLEFSHIAVSGGNSRVGIGVHQSEASEIRYKDLNQEQFTHRVVNDTLYIKFKDGLTRSKADRWTYEKVIVKYKKIDSYTFEDSQGFFFAKDLSILKLIGSGISLLNIHLNKIDSLDIKVSDYTKIRGNKPSNTNYLNVKANNKSFIKFNISVAKQKNINKEEEAKVFL